VVPRLSLRYDAGDPGTSPRQWVLEGRALRRARRAAWTMVVLAGLLVTGLLVLSMRSVRLASTVAELESDLQRVEELARTLEETEAAYQRLTALFAPSAENPGGLWLPPVGPARATGAAGSPERGDAGEGEIAPPSGWPLAERGFLTQPLVPGSTTEAGSHPGIDLAVPSGSYVRSIGPGIVLSRGEDELYGLYVVVEHPGGYRSLYAHASVVVVEPGRSVREGEVLGLTGSSGRSTAPHLHLELTRDGEHLDPLTVLVRP
jgi:murein DD-endopeptidase MepM/ murein hydrolase activator NlpD